MRFRKLIGLAAALALSACGGDSEDTSSQAPDRQNDGDSHVDVSGPCSTRHCEAPELYTCFEWGVDDDEHVRLCEQFGGQVVDGGCPDADKVAGCKSTSPFTDTGCVINWGYAPALVEDDIRADCEGRKGELVH
jgi:hypothetical protein